MGVDPDDGGNPELLSELFTFDGLDASSLRSEKMNKSKNNRIVALVAAFILMLCALPTEWMVISNASVTSGGFPGGFPNFAGMSLSVTGLNGHISLGVKMPIWLIVVIGIVGLILAFLNTARITELPNGALIIPLGISLLFVMFGIGVGVFSNDASLSIGGFLALSGLAIGLWNTLFVASEIT